MPSKSDTTLAGALGGLLRDAGISASELARRSGLSPDAIGHYLAGDREPSLTAARMLCRGLGIGLDELCGRLAPLPPVPPVTARPRGRPLAKPPAAEEGGKMTVGRTPRKRGAR